MKRTLLILALLGWGYTTALGQSADPPVPASVSTTIEQVAPDGRSDRVLGVLTGGSAALQTLQGLGGEAAMAGSRAEILQQGDGNATLLRQYGPNNAASIRLVGDHNTVDAAQVYGDNALGLFIEGSGNTIPVRQYNLLGRGNQLSLTLIGVNGVDLPVPITQVGGGIPVDITVRRGTP